MPERIGPSTVDRTLRMSSISCSLKCLVLETDLYEQGPEVDSYPGHCDCLDSAVSLRPRSKAVDLMIDVPHFFVVVDSRAHIHSVLERRLHLAGD